MEQIQQLEQAVEKLLKAIQRQNHIKNVYILLHHQKAKNLSNCSHSNSMYSEQKLNSQVTTSVACIIAMRKKYKSKFFGMDYEP